MFEKIKKRYALNNSYFKNCRPQDPQTPNECFDYLEQHDELPYNLEEDENWLEDCFAEYQKRNTDYKLRGQFFTPPKTAKRMMALLDEYAFKKSPFALDMCCGYGVLSKDNPFIMKGLDIDKNLCELYEKYTENEAINIDFMDYTEKETAVIANPPYTIKLLTAFLNKLSETLEKDGVAVLLLPKGFMEKERPKDTVEVINKFEIIYKEKMEEEFSRTKMCAEIVILKLT